MITLENLFEMYLETTKCKENPMAEELKVKIKEKIFTILYEEEANKINGKNSM